MINLIPLWVYILIGVIFGFGRLFLGHPAGNQASLTMFYFANVFGVLWWAQYPVKTKKQGYWKIFGMAIHATFLFLGIMYMLSLFGITIMSTLSETGA